MACAPSPPSLEGVFFLCGPTAAGKTQIALAAAEALGAEIVGADAFQVYQGLDTLSAKPSAEALRHVPHHLVGVVPLSESFHAGRYQKMARAALADIRARGKPALVVGAAGLYLRALTRGLAELPPTPPPLRAELAALPLEALVERLRARDPQAAACVDLQNPRRVARALEISLLTGQPFSHFRREWERETPYHGLLLTRPRPELYARIDERAAALLEGEALALAEVRTALREERASGKPVSATARQMIGWRELCAHLEGRLSRCEAVDAIARATRRYAKRQSTWFAREPALTPLLWEMGMAAEAVLAQVLQHARRALG